MADLARLLTSMTPVKAGDDLYAVVTAARINAIQEAIKGLMRGDNLANGPGILINKIGSGQISLSSTAKGGGGTVTLEHPFQIYDGTAANQIKVRYGTLQDIEPTDVGTDVTLATDDTHDIYLDVEVDLAGTVIAATLATGTKPADEDYHGNILLGTVEVYESTVIAINQACTHSLRLAMCGRTDDEVDLLTRGTYDFRGF